MNLVDFIADFTHDSSLAHSSIEGFIDYGDGKLSILSKLECSKECLKGRYEGNFDIRNSRYVEGHFQVIRMMKTEFYYYHRLFLMLLESVKTDYRLKMWHLVT